MATLKASLEGRKKAKKVLKEKGLTQTSLEERLLLCHATINKFFNGHYIYRENFEKICKLLKLNWEEICDYNESEKESPSAVVPLDSRFYVERPPTESNCYREILNPGSLIRIQSPKQTGKSSLLLRICKYASQLGYKTVYLNLHDEADYSVLNNLDNFLQWLSTNVCEQLELNSQLRQLNNHWNKNQGSKIACTQYFENFVLKKIDIPLVLGLDNIDHIFEYPQIAKEFFSLLRLWFNNARTRRIWKKLRQVLAYSTGVYIQLDLNTSPFNVGEIIELPGFTEEQIAVLAEHHGLNWSANQEAQQLTAMVGGHPYLIRLALDKISYKEKTLEEVLQDAPTDNGIYAAHLKRSLQDVSQEQELKEALKAVVLATSPVKLEPTPKIKLEGMGLVKLENNQVKPSCKLYRLYFREHLG